MSLLNSSPPWSESPWQEVAPNLSSDPVWGGGLVGSLRLATACLPQLEKICS